MAVETIFVMFDPVGRPRLGNRGGANVIGPWRLHLQRARAKAPAAICRIRFHWRRIHRRYRKVEGKKTMPISQNLRDLIGADAPLWAGDSAIGAACQKVFDDEFGHMMHGVMGIDDEGLGDDDWRELTALTVEQLRLRLFMRNTQFSHPLTDQRIQEILDGKIEPVAFDFDKAETYLYGARRICRTKAFGRYLYHCANHPPLPSCPGLSPASMDHRNKSTAVRFIWRARPVIPVSARG